jgi:hypothetical protein
MPDNTPIKVNIDNYVHAETSLQFERIMKMARGMNQLSHGRLPVPINRQPIARMNRDTIYSSALVDISAGATVTLPETGQRYLSVVILNENNHTTAIYHNAGTYKLDPQEHLTPFVAVIARILVNPEDETDMVIAHALQDQLVVEAQSSNVFSRPAYDVDSHKHTHKALQLLGEGLADAAGCSGKAEEIKETRHMVATAFGWGGLPEYEVVYFNSVVDRPPSHYQFIIRDVPVDGFWSISIYNQSGFFGENPYHSYSINNIIAQADADGAVTVNLASEPADHENFLYIMEGWSYVVRLYQPHFEVIDGSWSFPEPVAV